MHDPTIDLEEDDYVSLPTSDYDEEDRDIGGKDQSAYHKACRRYEEKLAARKAMKPKERAAAIELERCQALLRMLRRPPSSDEDMNAFFIMISDTPDQVNLPVDFGGNTLAHYLANPNQTIASWDDEGNPTMRPTTDREQQALSEWQEVILQWAKADPFIPNHRGLTAVDVASTVSPTQVELLTFFDSSLTDRQRDRIKARAVFMAAAGLAEESVTTEEVDDMILALGTFIDTDGEFLVCGGQLRIADTFREFLLSDHIKDEEHRQHLRAVLLPKEVASKL